MAVTPYELERVSATYARVVRLWARLPGLYRAAEWIAFCGRPNTRRREVVDALGVGPGARVLELGCGTGRNFGYILMRIGPSGRLVGVDASAEMLSSAKRTCEMRGWHNVTLVQGDASELEIGGATFDGVLSVLAVNGLAHPVGVLRCAHARLRPGGRYVVCDIQPFAGWASVLNSAVRKVLGALFRWDPKLDVPADLRSVFGNVETVQHAKGAILVAMARRREVAS